MSVERSGEAEKEPVPPSFDIPPVIPVPIASSPHEVGAMPMRPWGFWATVGLALAILVAAIMAQGVGAVVWSVVTGATRHGALREAAESNGLLLSMATCAALPVVLGLTFLFASIRVGPRAVFYLGFRPVPGKALFRWSVALLVLIALSDALTAALGRPIVPPFMVEAYQTAGFLPLLWFTLLVAAPVAEETLFRGFLFEGILHSRLGAPGAVILSALPWALIHIQYDLYGIASIFVAGLFLGYVRLKTKSIYSTMLLHSLMNLIATVETVVTLKVQS